MLDRYDEGMPLLPWWTKRNDTDDNDGALRDGRSRRASGAGIFGRDGTKSGLLDGHFEEDFADGDGDGASANTFKTAMIDPYCRSRVVGQLPTAVSFDVHTVGAQVRACVRRTRTFVVCTCV